MDSQVKPGAFDPEGPVFISYRRSDGSRLAELLDTFLRAGGISPWRDLVDLPPGETAARIRDAFEGGIGAAILLVTEELRCSSFVPAHEVPPLLELQQQHKQFQFLVANTLAADSDAEEINPERSDELFPDREFGLKDLKHYALLQPRHELRQMLHDLLDARLTARRSRLVDREVKIQTQTRPEPDAKSRFSGSGDDIHDLTIRLRQDRETGIPEELGYRCLALALPILVDSLYQHGVNFVTHSGGGHPSVCWAFGAAIPATWGENYLGKDLHGERWPGTVTEEAQQTFTVRPQDLDPEGSAVHEVDNVAVLLNYAGNSNLTAFKGLLAGLPGTKRGVILHVEPKQSPAPGQRPPDIPAPEGARLAKEITAQLKKLAVGNTVLHIASNLPAMLMTLCGRQSNTLSVVFHEWGRNWETGERAYVAAIRIQAGAPGGPITKVFPQRRFSWDDEVTELVNLTPHAVQVISNGQVVKRWPAPQGDWVRVHEDLLDRSHVTCEGTDISVDMVIPGKVSPQPPAVAGRGYIVSRVSAAASSRTDFFFPLGEVRDSNNQILGVKGLGRFPASDLTTAGLLRFLDHPCANCGDVTDPASRLDSEGDEE